jgi:hypothetical protein
VTCSPARLPGQPPEDVWHGSDERDPNRGSRDDQPRIGWTLGRVFAVELQAPSARDERERKGSQASTPRSTPQLRVRRDTDLDLATPGPVELYPNAMLTSRNRECPGFAGADIAGRLAVDEDPIAPQTPAPGATTVKNDQGSGVDECTVRIRNP